MGEMAAEIQSWLQSLDSTWAYVSIFLVLLACGLGLPVPEDITLVTAGILVYEESISLLPTVFLCLLGVLSGDFILFFFGRFYKNKIMDSRLLRFLGLTPEKILYAKQKLKNNANLVCFTARFLAGLRAPIFITAGMLGVRPRVFMLMDTLAALISVPLLVCGAWYFGEEIETVLVKARPYFFSILGALVIAAIAYGYIKRRVASQAKT